MNHRILFALAALVVTGCAGGASAPGVPNGLRTSQKPKVASRPPIVATESYHLAVMQNNPSLYYELNEPVGSTLVLANGNAGGYVDQPVGSAVSLGNTPDLTMGDTMAIFNGGSGTPATNVIYDNHQIRYSHAGTFGLGAAGMAVDFLLRLDAYPDPDAVLLSGGFSSVAGRTGDEPYSVRFAHISHEILFKINGNDTVYYNTDLALNTTYYIAATYDVASGTSSLYVMQPGLCTSTPTNTTTGTPGMTLPDNYDDTPIGGNGNDFTIGAQYVAGGLYDMPFSTGRLSNVAMYSEFPLTGADILMHCEAI